MISLAIQDTLRQIAWIARVNDDREAKTISSSYKLSLLSEKEQQHRDSNATRAIFIEADRERMMQVLINLLDNALKFTRENDTISVIVEEQENEDDNIKEVVVNIKDTGTGIDPEIMPKLFTKFCTKSSSVTRTTGTGLGLYIAKSIIEAHDGRIWANNNAQDSGATFAFSLLLSNKDQD